MQRRIAALLVTAATLIAGCSSSSSGPSIADGGLPVYSVGAPEGLETLEVAESLADVLELPDDVRVGTAGQSETRIESRDHNGRVRDRGAGTLRVSYSGPRFENAGCIGCPLLDETDDVTDAIERSRVILDAISVDSSAIEFAESYRFDDRFALTGTVVIDGAPIDDLTFNFVWTHGLELSSFSGGIFEVETIGTVAPRDEADARAQAENMIGSERTITDFTLTYIGAFQDAELIVAPAYLATTDLGTTFTVSAFTGELPT